MISHSLAPHPKTATPNYIQLDPAFPTVPLFLNLLLTLCSINLSITLPLKHLPKFPGVYLGEKGKGLFVLLSFTVIQRPSSTGEGRLSHLSTELQRPGKEGSLSVETVSSKFTFFHSLFNSPM